MAKQKKILIIKGQSKYDILRIATDYVATEFENRGYNVDLLDLCNGTYQTYYRMILDNIYDMIFAFNGLTLDFTDNNNINIINHSDVPFTTYLVDHPIYQYSRLACNYKNLNVATFDRDNIKFVKKYYSYIKYAEFVPFFGFQASEIIPFNERNIDILFVGSYYDPQIYLKDIKALQGAFRVVADNTLDILLANTNYTLEQAIMAYLNSINFEITDKEFLDLISIMTPVDKYIRNYFRDKVVRTVMDAGLTLTVYGNGWEALKEEYGDKLNLLNDKNTNLLEGIEIMANSKIILSVMPWFKDAIQDRIISTMLCGAACVTDTSKYMIENLTDNENIIFYDLDNISYLPFKLKYLLENHEMSSEVAENGRQIANERYTVKQFVDKIIQFTPKNYKLYLKDDFITKYEHTADIEINNILDFVKTYNNIGVYNYPFILKYLSQHVEVYFDNDVEMFYVDHHGKRMYYPKKYKSKEEVAQNYRFISLEQDMNSPHRYLDDTIMVHNGDVVVDAGVAEGNFALDVVDKVSKLYLIECDQGWVEALEHSFEPFKDKVVIINKFLSDTDDDYNITIDNLTSDKINFIKMDIEGNEVKALEHAKCAFENTDQLTCTICSYHNSGDEVKIANILGKHKMDISTTTGYMFFLHDEVALKNLELRRGLVRGIKH